MALKKSQLYSSLWQSCDELRGGMDASQYKDEEQAAIAAVLSDVDSEIKSLEQRLDKIRHTKQDMMQQLLTGRVRLV